MCQNHVNISWYHTVRDLISCRAVFSFRSKSNYQTQPANQITKKLNQISVVNANLTVNDREHFATFTTHLPLIYHIFEQPNFIINSHYPREKMSHFNSNSKVCNWTVAFQIQPTKVGETFISNEIWGILVHLVNFYIIQIIWPIYGS